jgi:hypothetical protein
MTWTAPGPCTNAPPRATRTHTHTHAPTHAHLPDDAVAVEGRLHLGELDGREEDLGDRARVHLGDGALQRRAPGRGQHGGGGRPTACSTAAARLIVDEGRERLLVHAREADLPAAVCVCVCVCFGGGGLWSVKLH